MGITKKISEEEELSEQTLEDIRTANKQYAAGKGFTTKKILNIILKKTIE